MLSVHNRWELEEFRCIFLDVAAPAAAKRVGLARDRPVSRSTPGPSCNKLLVERRPLYEQVSVAAVTTDGRTPDQVADDVLTALEPWPYPLEPR